MAKLGTYSYPDIRFGDAVEIAGRILTKFRGAVTVKGLSWELGMAENSGTLFAKTAALRDFGLVEGRGELRVSDLGRKILHPATPEEGHHSRIQAFQRVDLLRTLYERFDGEAPDDSSLLIGLEEITKAPREEIVRRFTLIQKHLADATRVMKHAPTPVAAEPSGGTQQPFSHRTSHPQEASAEASGVPSGLCLVVADKARLNVPLTPGYVDMAINLLRALRVEMEEAPQEESNAAQG